MGKKTYNHIHKYKKIDMAAKGRPPYIVFKCIIATCTHYVPWKLAEGKMCLCNRCGDAILLNKANMILAYPHCTECTVKQNPEVIDSIADFLKTNPV